MKNKFWKIDKKNPPLNKKIIVLRENLDMHFATCQPGETDFIKYDIIADLATEIIFCDITHWTFPPELPKLKV